MLTPGRARKLLWWSGSTQVEGDHCPARAEGGRWCCLTDREWADIISSVESGRQWRWVGGAKCEKPQNDRLTVQVSSPNWASDSEFTCPLFIHEMYISPLLWAILALALRGGAETAGRSLPGFAECCRKRLELQEQGSRMMAKSFIHHAEGAW